MGLLRLGIITIFLSDSLVSGYTAAAAFTILITQISFLFGLDGVEAFVHPGLFATPRVSNCRAGGSQDKKKSGKREGRKWKKMEKKW